MGSIFPRPNCCIASKIYFPSLTRVFYVHKYILIKYIYFRSRYNAIHCIALPRIGSIQDEQLWQKQMEKLKSLIFRRVEAQMRLRIGKKASFNRRQAFFFYFCIFYLIILL
jgi:hypothetical protein